MTETGRPARFVPAEQGAPPAEPVTDSVVQRFEHVLEVDPRLMGRYFRQQDMPKWDTFRIVDARWDHLSDVHQAFADSVLQAGEEADK
jgi:hypothetical protein